MSEKENVTLQNYQLLLTSPIVASYQSLNGKVTQRIFYTHADLAKFLEMLPANEVAKWAFKKQKEK
jgi:hypothetical protein